MYGYNGVSKRWVEGLYAGSYRPGENGIEIRSQFFGRYLGRDNVTVPNVGFREIMTSQGKKRIAKPLIIATDLLEGVLDSNGNQKQGESDGLYYCNINDIDNNEPTFKPLELLLKRIEEEKLLTIFPGDQHENPSAFDMNALSTTILDTDLSKLSSRERAIVQQRYIQWLGKRLPLGIWADIFLQKTNDNPRGQLVGKEWRNFLPHCTEYVVKYIDIVQKMFDKQKIEIANQLTNQGELVPTAYWFPVAKDGLTVDLPGDERGMGGNKFDELIKAAFTGDYFQGDDHRNEKRAIVVGAVSEYSVRLAIEHLIDADINVIWLLTCTKNFGFFSSKLYDAHYLMERYGKKLFCTYDWIEELLGPKPKGWDALQKNVMQKDREQHQVWWTEYNKQISMGKTSLGKDIIITGKQVIKELI